MREVIETELGVINGRDAILLNSVNQSVNPCHIVLEGEVNSRLCSNLFEDKKVMIPYRISFDEVAFYKVWELDFYPSENDICSSFDTMRFDGESVPHFNHLLYVFSTYDYIFEIAAKSYKLEFYNYKISR